MTLIELMTAIAVLAILMAIAVPSFRQFMADSRATALTNDLVTALNVARSEALRSSADTKVCASPDPVAAAPVCSGTDWSQGWLVFVDRNNDGVIDVAGNPSELVQVYPQSGEGTTINVADSKGNGVTQVTYNAMGMGELPASTSFIQFDVTPKVCSGKRAGRTRVWMSGAVESSKVDCPT